MRMAAITDQRTVVQTAQQSPTPYLLNSLNSLTVLRKALQTYPNESIKKLWGENGNSKNIHYNTYNSTKQVLKDICSREEDKYFNQLTFPFYQNYEVFVFPTHKNFVGCSVESSAKHIQLYNTIHQPLFSNSPKPYQMGFVINVRLSEMSSSRKTSARSSWVPIVPGTICMET